MSLLHLDYQRSYRPVPRFGIGVLVLALAVLVAGGMRYAWLVENTAQLEAQAKALKLASSERAMATGPRGGKEDVALTQEIRQANLVLRDLSVPWDALFQAVEASSDKDVTLLSMEPDVDKQAAKIIGEAKNMAAVLNYMRLLGKQQVLHDINLQHHQIQQQDPERPVRFTLVAGWEFKS